MSFLSFFIFIMDDGPFALFLNSVDGLELRGWSQSTLAENGQNARGVSVWYDKSETHMTNLTGKSNCSEMAERAGRKNRL